MAQAKLSDRDYAESKHAYTDPRTGMRYASVTSIVGAFDSGDKLGRGAMAAAKLERQGINFREAWDSKRDVGTRVHSYADLLLNGKTAQIPDEDGPWMDSFLAWCREVGPEWLITETPGVGSVPCPMCDGTKVFGGPFGTPCVICKGTGRLGFGGRFDAIGYWDSAFWIVDFKTGKPYRPELTLQLAGYANFDGVLVYDDEGKAVDLDPLPHIERWGGLYIHEDSCTLVECPDPGKVVPDWSMDQMQAEAFEAFKGLLFAKEWGKQINRRGK